MFKNIVENLPPQKFSRIFLKVIFVDSCKLQIDVEANPTNEIYRNYVNKIK